MAPLALATSLSLKAHQAERAHQPPVCSSRSHCAAMFSRHSREGESGGPSWNCPNGKTVFPEGFLDEPMVPA
jgi:hypothetical protein